MTDRKMLKISAHRTSEILDKREDLKDEEEDFSEYESMMQEVILGSLRLRALQ